MPNNNTSYANQATSNFADSIPTLPQAIETEREILSALLMEGADCVLQAIVKGLTEESFSIDSHRRIFLALKNIADGQGEITHGTLIDYLISKHELDKVGGHAFVGQFIHGRYPDKDKLLGLIKKLDEVQFKRRTAKYANRLLQLSCNGATPSDIARFKESFPAYSTDADYSILRSWGEFAKQSFPLGDAILHELERGEICLLAAVTNVGKSTYLRNLMLSLTCGRPFPPIATKRQARRVLLLDFETRKQRLQRDIKTMIRNFSIEEKALVDRNLLIMCDERIQDDPLTLSNPRHLEFICSSAMPFKPDLIIIDTVSAAFCVRDENSNAEIGNTVFKPLMNIAQELNAAIVLAHHIGKSGSEEGRTAERAYKARGASSFATYPAMVINLTEEKNNVPDRITLSLAKVKGDSFPDEIFQLDRSTRWFSRTGEQPITLPSATDRLIALMGDGQERATKEIIATLTKESFSERAIENALTNATNQNKLTKSGRGRYKIPSLFTNSPG